MTDTDSIVCRINGQDIALPRGTSLLGFLAMKNVPKDAVVIEHNKSVLPKGKYEGIVLSEGDALEIVQLIGGG